MKHKVFKVKTGLKAGGDCPDMWQEYVEKCGQGQAQDRDDPSWAQRGQDIGRGWAQRGMDIGRQFAGGWW
jgi:hypothetical protein